MKTLSIRNYKGIKDLKIDFDGAGAIFFGENGTGKSSVLKAVATLFFPVIDLLVPDKNKAIRLSDSDMTQEALQTELACVIQFDKTRREFKISRVPSEPVELSETYGQLMLMPAESLKKKTSVTFRNEIDPVQLELMKGDFIGNFDDHGSYTPLILYYSAFRLLDSLRGNDENRIYPSDFNIGEEIYYNCLDPNTYFGEFFAWYCAELAKEEESGLTNKKLDKGRTVICTFLPEISSISLKRHYKQDMLLFRKKGKDFTIEQLSEGERIIISLIGDIVRRLYTANPHMENPLEADAIIMIDEIELHLHPRWQRHIIHNLRTAFPNVQFLLTTHSPQILGELKDEISLFKFFRTEQDEVVCEQIESTFGKDSNYILEQFMDTKKENEEISRDLNQLFLHIAAGNYDQAQILYDSLSSVLTKQHPELVKAEILIRRGTFRK
ncbi:MAG TPA: AAA family ATPase [Thermotogota bacterium]|nr:AAA family ATPase [Thermotogota bacterium]HPJ89117.1 AAA family ATPase [Thermotogota bacterium]